MAEFINSFFGGEKNQAPVAASDDDFADFATPSVATPSPVAAASVSPLSSIASSPTGLPVSTGPWYAVWERAELSDFKFEGYVGLLLLFVIGTHVWGTRRNRAIAKKFISSVTPVLTQEFACVGFDSLGRANTLNTSPLSEIGVEKEFNPELAIKENHALEFISYASGRQNIAFMHTTLTLQRRNNPVAWIGENLFSFFLDSVPAPADTATITISPFDGQDAGKQGGGHNSKFDNFVWALVNKRDMKRWRDERYDLSLTTTKDWEGLPSWLAVMSESKEIGDTVLFKELKDAVTECQDVLEYLIVTDQPVDKPMELKETVPKKRITLKLTLPSSEKSAAAVPALLSAFIRLVDHLVLTAHFRPEVLRKVKSVREEEIRKLQKIADEEKAEERMMKRDEEKKREREEKLRSMSAEDQKKFLEKEREKEGRKAAKRQMKKA